MAIPYECLSTESDGIAVYGEWIVNEMRISDKARHRISLDNL